MLLYMDWNVLNKIEQLQKLSDDERGLNSDILSFIGKEDIQVPYSNAHISDLYRGYIKNPDYIEGHLNTLDSISKGLCICQFWGEEEAVFHWRDPYAFFEEHVKEKQEEPQTFLGLFDVFKDYPAGMYTLEIIPDSDSQDVYMGRFVKQ